MRGRGSASCHPLLVPLSLHLIRFVFCLAVFFNDIIYYCKRAPQCMEEAKLREGKQKGRRTITQASIIMSNRILLRCVFLISFPASAEQV